MLTLSFGAEGNSEEQRKLERLFKAYNQMMFYVANRILNDEDDADDAVQQAFLRVMNHLDDIDEEDEQKTKSYLSIISRNIAIDIYRKKKQEMVRNISYDEYEIFIEDPSGQDFEVWEGILGNKIEEAITKLPAQYAEVIQLTYGCEYSSEEIGAMLNISSDNVRQRLVRARKKLAEILKEIDAGEQ